MGIVTGFLCIICFCVLAGKLLTRKCHFEKIDKMLLRLHKPASGILLVCVILHIAFVFPVIKNRSVCVNLSGVAIVILIVMLIALCHMMKHKKQRMRWHRIFTVIIAVGIIGHMMAYYIDFHAYRENIKNISVDEVELTELADGSYEGEYDAGYIYARVAVEIRDGRIISVDLLEHRNERGEPAESILDTVLEQQNIDVDTVSGATNSSKVIKKAIENALKNVR